MKKFLPVLYLIGAVLFLVLSIRMFNSYRGDVDRSLIASILENLFLILVVLFPVVIGACWVKKGSVHKFLITFPLTFLGILTLLNLVVMFYENKYVVFQWPKGERFYEAKYVVSLWTMGILFVLSVIFWFLGRRKKISKIWSLNLFLTFLYCRGLELIITLLWMFYMSWYSLIASLFS